MSEIMPEYEKRIHDELPYGINDKTLNQTSEINLGFKALPDEMIEHDLTDKPDFMAFLARIGREDLATIITDKTPWLYFSQEIYREKEFGIKGGGGLGVLAGDTTRVAEELGLPLVVVTPFYSEKSHQLLVNFRHTDEYETVAPEEYRFRKIGGVAVSTRVHSEVPIEIHAKKRGSTKIVTLYEPNIGPLYPGSPSSDHRLYQEIVNGFGGYQAIKEAGLKPPVMQMNEAPTVFAAIARLDDLCSQNTNLYNALDQVKKLVIYTNHTLVPAVEGEFSIEQFEHFVMPNIKSQDVINWIYEQFNGRDKIKLSSLAIELSLKKNGVSKLHAAVSSQSYHDKTGGSVKFEAVTNGISSHWISPEFINEYHKIGALDEFNLPTEDYAEALDSLDAQTLLDIKKSNRANMNKILAGRKDQYGNPVNIPETAKLFDFKRRFVSYKRAKMIFHDIDRLAGIVDKNDAHVIFSGKPHSSDIPMIDELNQLFLAIDNNPILKERVHYIQDYDEAVGLALSTGSDCAINVPVVGEEACGTSWMKDIANGKLLISTEDGGVADVIPPVYLDVRGSNYEEEADILYNRMQEACDILSDGENLKNQVAKQLKAYLPIISGSRMIADYLDLRFERTKQ